MPNYTIPPQTLNLPRNIALLDTNVLVALVDHRDSLHEETVAAIDLSEYVWIVAYPVIVEAWNLLASRNGREAEASYMLRWLLTPGNAILLNDNLDSLPQHSLNTEKYEIDIVDAALMKLANDITTAGNYHPAVHVATFDTRDFLKCFGRPGLSFNVFDMRQLSSTADT